MAIINVSRDRKTYTILQANAVGAGPDVYRILSRSAVGASSASPLSFQITVYDKALPPTSVVPDAESAFDWALAPPWAGYAAINEDGTGWWYECRPVRNEANGTWNTLYAPNRAWPMPRPVHLYRCWRESFEERPYAFRPVCTPQAPCLAPGGICTCGLNRGDTNAPSCSTPGSGCCSGCSGSGACGGGCTTAAVPVPAGLDSAPSTPLQLPNNPVVSDPVVADCTATVRVEASNDGIAWISLGEEDVQTNVSPTAGFTSLASWAYIRGKIVAITGETAEVLVTMGV